MCWCPCFHSRTSVQSLCSSIFESISSPSCSTSSHWVMVTGHRVNAAKRTEREYGLLSGESPKSWGQCWIVLCRFLPRQLTIPLNVCPNKLQEKAHLIAKPVSLSGTSNWGTFPMSWKDKCSIFWSIFRSIFHMRRGWERSVQPGEEKLSAHQLPDHVTSTHIFPPFRVKMQTPAYTPIQKNLLCSCQVTAGLSVLLRVRFPPSDSWCCSFRNLKTMALIHLENCPSSGVLLPSSGLQHELVFMSVLSICVDLCGFLCVHILFLLYVSGCVHIVHTCLVSLPFGAGDTELQQPCLCWATGFNSSCHHPLLFTELLSLIDLGRQISWLPCL